MEDEARRLAALRSYALLDTPPEPALDEITRLAAQICRAPMATISLLDEHRLWVKSSYQLACQEAPRTGTFCDLAIRAVSILQVPDAAADPRFANSPLVLAEPSVRFYAGAPLLNEAGLALGTLCVMDFVPRELTAEQLDALQVLSRQVMHLLELRRQTREAAASEERLRVVTDNARIGLVIVNRERRYVYANPTYSHILDLPPGPLEGRRIRDVLPDLYDGQISPRLDRAFAGERVSYELQRHAPQDAYYLVNYEPTMVEGRWEFVVVVIADITERRKMELRLRDQEETLEVTGRIADVGGWEFDPRTGQGSWTAQVARIHDLPPDHPTNVELGLSYYLPGSRERIAAAVQQACATGEPYDLELELRTATGRHRWVRTIAHPVVENGQVVRVRGSIQDITERKRAEADLTEAMRFSRATINALSAHICVLDETGAILATNRAWQQFGAQPENSWNSGEQGNYLTTCDAAAANGSADAAEFAAGIRAVIAGNAAAYQQEYPCHSPTEQRWFSGRVTRFTGDGPLRVVVAHEDVTERKRSERTATRLAAIVRSSEDAIIGLDLDGTITNWNRGAERLFGFEETEVLGKHLRQLVPAEFQPGEEDVLLRMLRGERVEHYESQRLTRLGHKIPVSITWSPIQDAAGRTIGISKVLRDLSRERRAEAAVLAGAELLRHIVNSVPSLVFAQDREHRYTLVNEACARFLGRPADEIVGRLLSEVLPPEMATRVMGENEEIMRSGQRLDNDETVLNRVVLTTRVPLRNAQGQVTGLCGVATDITERTRAEEAQRASDLRYRSLFEHAPDGILIADRNGQFIDVNANALGLLGYERRGLLGLQMQHLLDPADTQPARPAPGQPARAASLRREWRLRRRDGTTFPAEVTAGAMPDGNLLVMLRDITERKRAEDRFRRLVDSDAHGVMFWNEAGKVSGGNDAFIRLSGCTRRALERGEVGIPKLLPPGADDGPPLDFATVEGSVPLERELVRADGTRIPVLVGATSFEDNPAEGVCFLVDLSESKRLEQQFMRSQRLESIGTLAGGIAHDLNNALGPIQMALDLIEPMVANSAGKGLVTTIRAGAQRGADMVRQLLTFARGGMEGRRLAVQLRHLISDVAKIANDTFLKHITVHTVLRRDLRTVTGDPTQLHQLLLNLCVNARDAMPDGGALTLSAENVLLDQGRAVALGEPNTKLGMYVCVSVLDTGTGMTPAILEKIFDPFFTTKEPGKGTGLGLSTSLAIVKSHGGFLRVTSEPEKGSRFDIYLPAEQDPVAQAGADATASPPRGAGELILVVDDEASIRQITQQTLEFFGYRVQVASDGAEAVAAIALPNSEIRLMLTDMMMPIMDGPTCIRVIRRLRPNLPIIAASGLAANSQAPQQLTDLGVNGFLVKPYASESLLAEVARLLRPAP